MKPVGLVFLICVFLSVVAARAQAKTHVEVPYTLKEVYSAAARFVRIDRGCQITDRDPDAAFLTFECKDDERIKRGALELMVVQVQGQPGKSVRVQVGLGDDPHYMELRFLELFERKLRQELGNPPSVTPDSRDPKPPVEDRKPPDLGT